MAEEAFRLNFDLYNDQSEVNRWAERGELQMAERKIIEVLHDRLGFFDMLDVGVGGGRTTAHFAPLAKSYLGIDFAPNMIVACRERFPDLDLRVADASELREIDSCSFDFVLFSFNGIDYLSATARQRALNELSRVLRPDGCLAFSSHNLNFFPLFLHAQARWFSYRPSRILENVRRSIRFREANRHIQFTPELTTAVVFENRLNFTAPTFYVKPTHQIEILRNMGMQDIRLFPVDGGEVEIDSAETETITAPSIYYFCRSP